MNIVRYMIEQRWRDDKKEERKVMLFNMAREGKEKEDLASKIGAMLLYNQVIEEMLKKVTNKQALYKITDHGVFSKKHFICPTLTANMGTYPDRVPIIKDDYGIRKITPLECLALQGFPKDFMFKGISLNSAYKQCGNSVVVPVIRRIAEKIKDTLFN